MKKVTVELDPDEVIALRDLMIELRDEALAQSDFEWAVNLSHVVKTFSTLKDAINGTA